METLSPAAIDWTLLTHELGKAFASRAGLHDKEGIFAFSNYEDLKRHRFFSAAVPDELGGGGMSHAAVCGLIKTMAGYCGSTALAFSMHQHLVAASVWRYKHKGESVPLLKRIAQEQLVLVSTGARDWLDSNGEMVRTKEGFLFTARKSFASQSVAGDIAVTSAPFLHPEKGWEVLHFPVPLKAKGVSFENDWDVMGMRASGSQTIAFSDVFVPDSAIVLARPRNGYHPVWDVVITVAMPLIMAVYVGIAERAMEIALEMGKGYPRNQKHLPYMIGKMNNALVSARTQWKAMVALASNLDFTPDEKVTLDMLSLKTNVSDTCIEVVQNAMEVAGGQSFYRKNTLERLFRDIQAAQFHPLPRWEQYAFTGERLLK